MPKKAPAIPFAALMLLGVSAFAAGPARDEAKPAFANEVSITVEGDFRIIRANGIPNHNTGQFPNEGNPNTIAPQHYDFRVPANPRPAEKTTALRMQAFGVAVNGVVFDPGAAEWWNGDRAWQYEPMAMGAHFLGVDNSHAHVQPNGAYHYHGIPVALVDALTDGKEKMVIVGWAADGFPICNDVGHVDPKDAASAMKTLKSSYRVKSGERPSGPGGKYDGSFVADYEYVPGLGDLDECNGIFGVTPEYPSGIYHYVLTEQFPFIPRLYRGTPDASFERHPPRGGRAGGGLARGFAPGYHLLPAFAMEQLHLTAEQQRSILQLQKETKIKIDKILTAEQMKIWEETRPPGMGGPRGPGGGGPDGPPPDDAPGGPGGPQSRLKLLDRSAPEN